MGPTKQCGKRIEFDRYKFGGWILFPGLDDEAAGPRSGIYYPCRRGGNFFEHVLDDGLRRVHGPKLSSVFGTSGSTEAIAKRIVTRLDAFAHLLGEPILSGRNPIE